MINLNKEVESCLIFFQQTPTIICDVGANRGVYTAKAMQFAPEARYFLFEPAAANIHHLTQRFKSTSNVTIMPLALSNSHGEATLYAEASGAETGSMAQAHAHDVAAANDHLELIRTARIDSFWSELTSSSNGVVDWVKIDVEGFEFAVLEGFGDKIRSTRVIQFEYGARNIDTHTHLRDFWDFFQDNHFSLYRITPRGPKLISAYSPWEESAVTTNLIAVNQQLGS
jgi:FkbM family methyltransferase